MPEISVIIPIYNKGKYLKKLWENLLCQSFSDFECLLIDDGSTDQSGEFCDEIVARDSRFKVFHINNGGVSNARNLGIDNSKGEFITFIDADDGFHDDYLKNLYNCIIENSVDFVIGSSKKIWDGLNKTEDIMVPHIGVTCVKEYMPSFEKNQLSNGIYGYCWSKLMRRSLIGETRFSTEIHLAEDVDFYLSLYPKIDKIYFDNKPYYYYLQEAENSSMLMKDYEIDYFTQLKIQHKIYKTLESMGYLEGENKIFIERRICDYIFFTLFHAPENKIITYCEMIRNLNLDSAVDYKDRSFLQKSVLKNYFNKKDKRLVAFLQCYRAARKYFIS